VTKEEIRQAVLKVDPDKLYEVSYTIRQDGTKVYGNTFLLGADLTENQIAELAENGRL